VEVVVFQKVDMGTWYRDYGSINDPAARQWIEKAAVQERQASKRGKRDDRGRIVEILRGRRHLCGVVCQHYGAKNAPNVRVLDQEGKERTVRRDKILDMAKDKLELPSRVALVQALAEIARRRETIKQRLEMRPLWEMALESNNTSWSLVQLSQLYFAKTPNSDEQAGLLRALYEGAWFARQDADFVPLSAAAIEQRERQQREGEQQREQLEVAAHWLRQVADGQPGLPPSNAVEAIALLEDAVLFGKEGERCEEAAQLMQKAHLHGAKAAFEVLVKLGHWGEDENLELQRHKIAVEFSPEVEEEAESLVWLPAAAASRRWWRGQVWGWLENDEVCERAFSLRRTLKGYRLGIHLASPALLVPRDGAVDNAAFERGASMNIADRFVHMLPTAVRRAVGLTSTERKPCLTIAVEFDRQFAIKAYSIGVWKVQLKGVLVAPEHLDAKQEILHDIARHLRHSRLDAGALVLPEIRPKIVARKGNVDLLPRLIDSAAQLINGELTVLANALTGAFCATRDLPAVYRVALPVVERLVQQPTTDPLLLHQQRKSLPRTTLQLQPDRHHLVGWDTYGTIGRPLHRCEDLLMHRQLATYVLEGQVAYSAEEVERGLAGAAWVREAGPQVAGFGRRHWLLKYLEGRVGERVEALVVERVGLGLVVQILDCGLVDFVVGKAEVWARAGDVIGVEIAQVAARRNLLKLAKPQPHV